MHSVTCVIPKKRDHGSILNRTICFRHSGSMQNESGYGKSKKPKGNH